MKKTLIGILASILFFGGCVTYNAEQTQNIDNSETTINETSSTGTGGSGSTSEPGIEDGGKSDAEQEIIPCKHCWFWLHFPETTKYDQMCVSSVFIAQNVFKCAEDLGDCGQVLLGETPNVECLNALHESCNTPITECEQDIK